MRLSQHIKEALRNAEENGYKAELDKMSAEELATELRTFDADIEKFPYEQVLQAVEDIQDMIPDTVGDLIELLQKIDKDTPVTIWSEQNQRAGRALLIDECCHDGEGLLITHDIC